MIDLAIVIFDILGVFFIGYRLGVWSERKRVAVWKRV